MSKEPLNLPELIKTYRPKQLFLKPNKVRKEITQEVLYGIIVGDIVGVPYEGKTLSDKFKEKYMTVDLFDTSLSHSFSDDSVLSIAIYTAAKNCISQNLSGDRIEKEYEKQLRKFANLYPHAGYGMKFKEWALGRVDAEEYQSYGDGSAMRSGVLGAMFERVEDVIMHAAFASYPTHSHPEGMKGGIVTAVLVWMALNGMTEKKMRNYILRHYPDPLKADAYFNPVHAGLRLEQLEIPHKYITMSSDCATAVPLAWINFYESKNFEECLRNSLRYDTDTDTVMAISGGIAAAFYGLENKIQERKLQDVSKEYLDTFLSESINP